MASLRTSTSASYPEVMSDVDIRTKLILDDQATTSLNKIKSGFEEADKAKDKVQSGFAQFATTFAAMNVMPAIHQVVEFGKSFIDAARTASGEIRRIQSMYVMTTGVAAGEARAVAEKTHEHLKDIAISIGVPMEAISDGYRKITLITGSTEGGMKKATEQIEQMGRISANTGVDLTAMAMQWNLMATGMMPRATSEIGQLLKSTEEFRDMSESAGTKWAAMSDKERAGILDSALTSMSDKLKGMPPSLGQMITSFHEIVELAKETIGTPMLAEFMPIIKQAMIAIKESKGDIEEYAKALAKDVGAWAKDASAKFKEAMGWIRDHQEDIKKQIVEAWSFAKSVVEFILAHKEEIAVLYGAKMAAPAVGGVVSVGKSVVGAAAGGVPGLGLAAGSIAGAGGAAIALGAFSLAIGGVALAAWQTTKLLKETGGGLNENERDIKAITESLDAFANGAAKTRQWSKDEIKLFDDRRAKLLALGSAEHMNTRAMNDHIDALWNGHKAARASADQFRDLAGKMEAGTADPNEVVDKFTDGLTQAMNSGNEGMTIELAGMIAHGDFLKNGFLEVTTMTATAMDALANMIKGKGAELDALAVELDKKKGTILKPGDLNNKRPLTGSMTVNIKQDFRDQDPDRIAVVFERELTRSVENKLSTSMSGI